MWSSKGTRSQRGHAILENIQFAWTRPWAIWTKVSPALSSEMLSRWPSKIPSNLAHFMILLKPSCSLKIKQVQVWTNTRARIWHTGWPSVLNSTSAFSGSNALAGELCFPTWATVSVQKRNEWNIMTVFWEIRGKINNNNNSKEIHLAILAVSVQGRHNPYKHWIWQHYRGNIFLRMNYSCSILPVC